MKRPSLTVVGFKLQVDETQIEGNGVPSVIDVLDEDTQPPQPFTEDLSIYEADYRSAACLDSPDSDSDEEWKAEAPLFKA